MCQNRYRKGIKYMPDSQMNASLKIRSHSTLKNVRSGLLDVFRAVYRRY
jgi:hypothetical protein